MKNVFNTIKSSFPANYRGMSGTVKEITQIKVNGRTQTNVMFVPKGSPYVKLTLPIEQINI